MTKKRKTSRKKKKGKSPLAGILLIIFILVLLFAGSKAGLINVDWQALLSGKIDQAITLTDKSTPPTISTPAPVAVEPVSGGGKWYKLYFTSPKYPDKADTRTETAIVKGLIAAIDSSQSSLDIAIYELNLDEIGDAILAARERGVKVRMVTDTDTLEEDETLIRLKKEGIPLIPDERGAIMHNKFMVVDNKAVWTGSWNFTINGTYRNNNHAIYIQSAQLAKNYTVEFEELFAGKFGPKSPKNTVNPQLQVGGSLIETCFAPEDKCANQLVKLVNTAQSNIKFMAFSFTHDKLGQAVRNKARAGIAVQGVFEKRGSNTKYSEFTAMKKQKLDAVNVVQDGNPYTMHHKVFIIDDKTVVIGSFNFSKNADKSNDENILIVHNADIAGQFVAEFKRVYAQALAKQN